MVNGEWKMGKRCHCEEHSPCHCEERSDEAIPMCSAFEWDCHGAPRLAMTSEDQLKQNQKNLNKLR